MSQSFARKALWLFAAVAITLLLPREGSVTAVRLRPVDPPTFLQTGTDSGEVPSQEEAASPHVEEGASPSKPGPRDTMRSVGAGIVASPGFRGPLRGPSEGSTDGGKSAGLLPQLQGPQKISFPKVGLSFGRGKSKSQENQQAEDGDGATPRRTKRLAARFGLGKRQSGESPPENPPKKG
ncbi:hypothetical protein CSUI_000215, partial [Cystoisospora suis]